MPASLQHILQSFDNPDPTVLKELLEQGYKWPKNTANNPVLDLFHLAAYYPEKDYSGHLKCLLDHGLDPNWSLQDEQPKGVRQRITSAGLVSSNRGTILAGHSAGSLLTRAAGLGNLPMMALLLQAGADPWSTEIESAKSALYNAASLNKPEAVQWLFEHITPNPKQYGWLRPFFANVAHNPEVFESFIPWLPPLVNKASTEDDALWEKIATQIKKAHLDKPKVAMTCMAWFEQNPGQWTLLHNQLSHKDKWDSGLWSLLLDYSLQKGISNPVLEEALAMPDALEHLEKATTPQDAKTLNDKGNKHKTITVQLPVLQLFLHRTLQQHLRRRTNSTFSLLRNAQKIVHLLQKKGAHLWLGEHMHEGKISEFDLMDAPPSVFSRQWFQRNPEALSLSSSGDHAAFHVRSVHWANFWLQKPIDLNLTDSQGNTMGALWLTELTKIVSGSIPHTSHRTPFSSFSTWKDWLLGQWDLDAPQVPLVGEAYGLTIADISCARKDLFDTYARAAKKQNITPEYTMGALEMATYHNKIALVKKRLEQGANLFDLTRDRLSLYQVLADSINNSSDTDHNEKQNIELLNLLEDNHLPYLLPGQKEEVWETILSGSRTSYLYSSSYDRNVHPALARMFEKSTTQKNQRPESWTAEQIEVLYAYLIKNTENEYAHKRQWPVNFVRQWPQPVLDHLLFRTLFHDENQTSVTPALMQCLTQVGAAWDGMDLNGKKLIDIWPDAQKINAQTCEKAKMLYPHIQVSFDYHDLADDTPSIKNKTVVKKHRL